MPDSTYQSLSNEIKVVLSGQQDSKSCECCLIPWLCPQLVQPCAELRSMLLQGVLAQFYSLPWVSFRDATWRSMRQNVSGFSMDEIMALPRNDHHPNDRGHLCVLLPDGCGLEAP